jgi:hypothetical protein
MQHSGDAAKAGASNGSAKAVSLSLPPQRGIVMVRPISWGGFDKSQMS